MNKQFHPLAWFSSRSKLLLIKSWVIGLTRFLSRQSKKCWKFNTKCRRNCWKIVIASGGTIIKRAVLLFSFGITAQTYNFFYDKKLQFQKKTQEKKKREKSSGLKPTSKDPPSGKVWSKLIATPKISWLFL